MVVARSANRLPVTMSPPSRTAQVVKGIGAVLGTLLIVVGVPFGLLATVGPPWPSSAPDGGWLVAELTTGDLLKALGIVVWLAWAHFLVCLVVEVVAERRARGMAPAVPGGGVGTQTLARRLVGAMVLLVGSATMSVSTAAAASAPQTDHAPVVQQVAEQQSPQHHTASSVASSTDSGAAPQGAQPAGGTGSGQASAQRPAVEDLEPATRRDVAQQNQGQVTYYDVKPPSNRNYDTLWDIAERYLGDGFRYKEIYQLNKGATQPDGRILKNADLIHPGWVLRMPADAKGPGLKVVDHADQPSQDSQDQQGSAAAGSGADEAGPQAGHERSDEGARAGADAITGAARESDWAPVYGVAGGLVAAGVLLGLRRRRAGLGPAALWSARAGAGPHGPDGPGGGPGGLSAGVALRDEADLDTTRWVDRALRSWDTAEGATAPSRCTVAPSGIAVAFSTAPEAVAPDPWKTANDPRVWTLDRNADLGDQPYGPSPAPGLVSVGRRDDGSVLMLDLEAIPGLVSIGGDDAAARSVALSFAVDTATHPWADDCRVTLVGFADDLSAVGQGRLRAVDDLERVLDSLDNLASYQRTACRRADTVFARTARAQPGEAARWTYELVVCSGVPSSDAVRRLSDLAADRQVALAVVVVGDCPDAAARFAVSPGGRLTAGVLGVDVTAQQLPVSASRALAEMFHLPDARGTVPLDDVAQALSAEGVLGETEATEADPAVRVDLMGPLTVTTPSSPDPERSDLLTEVVTYVALHPAGVHANRIGAAIWPRGVSEETRDAALAQAQDWLGPAADGTPRLACEAGVWWLDRREVAVDWDAFRAALNHASDHPRGSDRILGNALSLVRGEPLQDRPEDRYSWLANAAVEEDMRMAVALTARNAAESAARRDDADAARDSLQRGLAMVPASEELWCAALRLAEQFAGPSDARVVADAMYAAIAEHGSPLGASAQTDALVDELLPGYRTRAA